MNQTEILFSIVRKPIVWRTLKLYNSLTARDQNVRIETKFWHEVIQSCGEKLSFYLRFVCSPEGSFGSNS